MVDEGVDEGYIADETNTNVASTLMSGLDSLMPGTDSVDEAEDEDFEGRSFEQQQTWENPIPQSRMRTLPLGRRLKALDDRSPAIMRGHLMDVRKKQEAMFKTIVANLLP